MAPKNLISRSTVPTPAASVAPADPGFAKAPYRVVRPILHNKTTLPVDTLVNMFPTKAQHLVETGALVAHYVPQVVGAVVDIEEAAEAVLGAVRSSNAEGEIAAATAAAGQVETDPTKIEAAAAEDRAQAAAATA